MAKGASGRMALFLRPARGEVHEGFHGLRLVCDAAGTGRIGVERWQPGMRLEESVSLSLSIGVLDPLSLFPTVGASSSFGLLEALRL
jgi:hypothetical protein